MRETKRLFNAACVPPAAAPYQRAPGWLRDPRALPPLHEARLVGLRESGRVAPARPLSPLWDAAEDEGATPLTRNRRSVWTVATQAYPGAHFATFPEKLVEPCILAGCREGGLVLDPFAGTGTVGVVAQRLSRRAVLIDLNADYLAQCLERNREQPLGLVEVPA